MTILCKPSGTPAQTLDHDIAEPATTSKDEVGLPSGSPNALLKPSDIESEGGPTVATQYVWASCNRHQWKSICLKIGRNLRYRRADWECWKESRRMTALEKKVGG